MMSPADRSEPSHRLVLPAEAGFALAVSFASAWLLPSLGRGLADGLFFSFSAGVVLGLLAAAKGSRRPVVGFALFLGTALGAVASGDHLPGAAGLAAAQLVEAVLVLWLLRHFDVEPALLDRLGSVAVFVLACFAAAMATGAAMALLARLAAPGEPLSIVAVAWRSWLLSQLVGSVAIAPLTAQLRSRLVERPGVNYTHLANVLIVVTGVLVLIGTIAPDADVLVLYASLFILPLVVWVGVANGVRRAAAATAILAIVTSSLTLGSAGLLGRNVVVGQAVTLAMSGFLLALGAMAQRLVVPGSRRDGERELGSARALMVLVPVMLFAAFAWWSWRDVAAQLDERVERASAAMVEHARRVFDVQESLLQAAIASLKGRDAETLAKDASVHSLLRHLQLTSPTSRLLAIVRLDTQRLVASSAELPAPPVDLSQREYVRMHIERNIETAVGGTIETASSGLTGFTYSRRIPDTDLVVVSLVAKPDFERLYRGQIDSRDDVLLLLRSDGAVLAGYPEARQVEPASAIKQLLTSHPRGIVAALDSDGVHRHFAIKELGEYPAAIVYGLATSAIRSAWLKRLAPFALFTLIAAILLQRLAARLQALASEAEAARSEAAAQRAISAAGTAAETARRESLESAARLAAIVDSSTDAIVGKTLEGVVTSWNEGAERLFGYAAAEMIGQPIHRLIPFERRSEEDDILARLSRGERIASFETQRLHKSGRRLEVSLAISPVRDSSGRIIGASKIARDIGDRKRAEARLRGSEVRFRSVFENAATGIAITDARGQIEDSNPALGEMLGFSSAQLVGRCMIEFFHPDELTRRKPELDRVWSGEVDEFVDQCRWQRSGGEDVWTRLQVAPLGDGDNGATRFVVLASDMTEQRQAVERQKLMMRELAHRGKNLLAVIQSIATRSMSGNIPLADARKAFQGRLQALARTYGTLTDEAFAGADLAQLIRSEVLIYSPRARIEGPPIMLSARAAQTMSLVIHELATNAAKYGALSHYGGRLQITWLTRSADPEPRFVLEWRESGSRAGSEPRGRGFGAVLISEVAGSEFQCQPELEFTPDGLVYRLDAPLGAIGRVRPSDLGQRFESGALRQLYELWQEDKRTPAGVPPFENFRRERLSSPDNLTIVEVPAKGAMRVLELGEMLVRNLGDAAEMVGAGTEHPDAVAEAYRRCADDRRPVFEHARFDFGDGAPVTFERLLVPYENESGLVVVVGVAVITGHPGGRRLPAAAGAASAISPLPE
ncbi:MAG: PAS domain S-box protein [Hyphomicrobiaceae bacterium]